MSQQAKGVLDSAKEAVQGAMESVKKAVAPSATEAPSQGATAAPSQERSGLEAQEGVQGTTSAQHRTDMVPGEQSGEQKGMAQKLATQAEPAAMLESASDAEKHRRERGEEEPKSPHKSALGRHYNIGGGRADFGPVDTDRNEQMDMRDIPARAP